MKVRKTRSKTVVTMDIGAFRANETVLYCSCGQTDFCSGRLRKIAPEKGTFGFDVIVKAGLALFVRGRTNREAMKDLAAENVFVSERQAGCLGGKFIAYLARAHRESMPRLRETIERKGGYILHIDGTCEGDSPNLFCGLDGISELVLDTVKIPSEKKELLAPFFRRVKEQYGEPKALVHDMGRGIAAGVEEVFPGVPDYICQFHFLRDIGKDLLQEEYAALRKRLQKFNVRSLLRQRAKYLEQKIEKSSRCLDDFAAILESADSRIAPVEKIPLMAAYTLIHWALDHRSQSNGFGFPFDRPHLDFYRRLQKVHAIVKDLASVSLRGVAKDNKPLESVLKVLKDVAEDPQLDNLAANLDSKAEVFDKLRTDMRIALPENKDGINDDGEENDMESMEERVTAFKNWLVEDPERKEVYAKMIEQLEKYWKKLFLAPLPIETAEGTVYIRPQRTNNILERFFREEKRLGRKKSGTASLNKMLKAILADTPLVKNLKNEEYVEIILGGCSDLAERFSEIDVRMIRKELEDSKKSNEKTLPGIRKLIKNPELIMKISSLFLQHAN